ncbi:MAG: hypothetical protein ACYC8W_07730 [Candidatus Tyrphobacter sp.]
MAEGEIDEANERARFITAKLADGSYRTHQTSEQYKDDANVISESDLEPVAKQDYLGKLLEHVERELGTADEATENVRAHFKVAVDQTLKR